MNFILGIVIMCEIGFWVVIALGLLARYVFRKRRTGAVLLMMTPVIDLVLLSAVIIHLQGGGTATFSHGLAALYLGVSLVYGPKMIAWADTRVAHRFANGPPPVKLYGRAYTTESWKDVVRTTVAVAIAAGIVWLLTTLVNDPDRTRALMGIYPVLWVWFMVDLIWAISYTFSPKKQPANVVSL
jgi:hypothetical protein